MTTRASTRGAAAQLQYESLHARVARPKAVIVDQVLPDGLRVTPARERLRDHLAEGPQALALGARPGRRRPLRPLSVGGHLPCGGRL
jgi:hypothetical protein